MDMTINPGKQRKARYEADIRLRGKHMSAHLSKELRGKNKQRSLPIKVGDTVKVMRGDYKGKTGNVNQVDRTRSKVFIQGLMRRKVDGKEAFLAFPPSNLLITSLESKDKRRVKKMTPASPTKKTETIPVKEAKANKEQ